MGREERQRTDRERAVIVIGAGYAGVMAANRLAASLTPGEAVRVTLVNPSDRFVERVRLHQLLAGSRDDVSLPLAEVLHPAVGLLVGSAQRIDPDARVVTVRTGGSSRTVGYDLLIYAVGSGHTEHLPEPLRAGYAVGDPARAAAAAAAVAAAHEQQVVVVGGGLTAIETAAELAARHPLARITLACAGRLGTALPERGRARVLRRLRRLRVEVREGTSVAAVLPGRVLLADGRELPADTCLLATSLGVPPLAADSGLPVDGLGRLRVDEHLRCPDHPEILGAGDAVALPPALGGHLRMSCAAALPLGGFAAESALAALHGTTPPVASVGFLMQCISLGPGSGYIQLVSTHDTPLPLAVSGRLGGVVKEAVIRMTVDALRRERVRPGSYRAPSAPVRRFEQVAPATDALTR